ncbi:MAG TPA: beta-N-acetylhexosaminidase [Bryobacteraceae bacterium]|nr:beta-N-acetylhexosaminidase [Bryobacteraceae bacterium]
MRLALFTSFFVLALPLAAHNPLLPRPQQLHYGSGRFALKGAHISFDSAPAAEDRFAAKELSAALHVPVAEGPGPAIVLKRTGAVDALPGANEHAGPNSREAYTLRIAPTGAEIDARSSAGIYYGTQTLRQMVEQEAWLPEAEIHDWPSLAYRAFMMDMSHAQLPTVEEIERQLDFLARWKTNQYYFYSEASIELKGFPLLMADARFTPDQVRRIIRYARERHIDVVPNLELYGHMHDLFRVERYADMGVFPHGGEFSRRDPHLNGLLSDWIAQISALFPSPFLHIGFDETWTLEREARAMGQTPEQLYLAQLREVAGMVEQHGKHALAWADMLEKYPAMIPQVPHGVIATPWHYMPSEIPRYPQILGEFQKAGVPTVIQGAVLNWIWCTPDYNRSFENIDALLAAGRAAGTLGFVNSGWADETLNLMRESWPAIAYGSVAAWESAPVGRDTFFDRYAAVLYPARTAPDVAAALTALARAQTLLQRGAGNSTIGAFWANPFAPDRLKTAQAHADDLHQSRLAAEEAQTHLMTALRDDNDLTLRTLMIGARLDDYEALKYIYAVEIANFWKQAAESRTKNDVNGMLYRETSDRYHTRTSDMMDLISELRDRFHDVWLAQYTPFRLRETLEKYDLEFQYWWKLQMRIRTFTQHYQDGEALPALETMTGSRMGE